MTDGDVQRGNSNLERVEALVEKITGDHERRLRYLERTMSWALGATGILYIVWQFISKALK